jgi:hypothetical protein
MTKPSSQLIPFLPPCAFKKIVKLELGLKASCKFVALLYTKPLEIGMVVPLCERSLQKGLIFVQHA